jgi:hypothetical protein
MPTGAAEADDTAKAAAPRIMLGIGEQHAAMFDDPLFDWLGMETARIVVPWDTPYVAYERERVARWLARAEDAGVDPVVAFGRTWDKDGHRTLPSLSRFRWAFRRFHRLHPEVKAYIPWNEPNHPKQPTWKRPEAAGRLYNAMKAECRSCTIVAGDMLDTPGMTDYTERYKTVLKTRPRVWGLHNYGDAYGRKNTATTQFLRITTGRLWLTETGGVVRRPKGRTGVSMRRRLKDAAGATRYVLHLAESFDRIDRVYLYQWAAADKAEWDSALVASNGGWRPAFNVAARFLRRDISKAPRPPAGPR